MGIVEGVASISPVNNFLVCLWAKQVFTGVTCIMLTNPGKKLGLYRLKIRFNDRYSLGLGNII